MHLYICFYININFKITQMELLQSVITNTYPSITTLLKFWINQLIDLIVNILTTYPINTLLTVLILISIVYQLLNKLFG